MGDGKGVIVVGVDGSPGARRALEWAVAEAAVRKARLVVVHTWVYPYVGSPAFVQVDPALLRDAARDLLAHVVAEAREQNADVEVEGSLVEGSAAHALIDAGKDADLIVVGSRGHGGFTGLLLGSVSQQCVHHAPCPVVVVPATD
ncbi:MAG TPA: universal stress protein [Acidimicrobiales bacterium]|nr:universal stress protein [Acidimicrobiales bacterium]